VNRNTISLGRILGIPIGLDYSWFLVFALLTWTLATSYYPIEFSHWPAIQYWVVGAVTASLFFASVLLHELGHSVIALRYNIPVRSITLFIFGGIAQIGAEPPGALAEFSIAIAGPLVSFGLAALFGLLQPLVAGAAPLLAVAKYLAYINGTLAAFNLIPGFPLDGGRVFRAIVWGLTHNLRRATLVAATVGRGIAFLFILFGVWQVFGGNPVGGLWIAFIGWFLESAAMGQVQQQTLHAMLAGHKVSEAMSKGYVAIPADTTLQQLVDHHILGSGQRSFIVEQGDAVAGLVTIHRIKEVPRETWPATPVNQIMVPMTQLKWVQPGAELSTALDEMDRDGVNQLPVLVDRQIQGMLTRDGIVNFLRKILSLPSPYLAMGERHG
jgi:Zn-dependent protease/CBS domain-containing protein